MAQVGEIIIWAGSSENFPPGFLNCNGDQISSTDPHYVALYNVIGNNFGANPQPGNFFLPDLRSRFIRGFDDGAGRDPDIGMRTDMQDNSLPYGGVGSIQIDALRSHEHQYTGLSDGSDALNISAGADFGNWQLATNATGGNETRPINAYLFFLICYQAS